MKTSFVIGVVLLSLFTVIHANTCELSESADVTCIAIDAIYEACNTTEVFSVTDGNALIESLQNVSTHYQYSCGRHNAEVYLASAILLTIKSEQKIIG